MDLSIASDIVQGNIVLVGSRVRIRVHRSVLMLHSEFFRRILALHPGDNEDSRRPPTLHLRQRDADLIHYVGAVYNVKECVQL